ncbi:hypothetical protein TNCV_2894611 [Trichonephila clavipes]|nr:hypothetical protein TNCV_2894611 [Trichonephila clavipes]
MIVIISFQLSSMEIYLSWAAMSGFSAEPIVILKGSIIGEKYRESLAYQVYPIMQTLLPAKDGIFQNDNGLIKTAGLVQS